MSAVTKDTGPARPDTRLPAGTRINALGRVLTIGQIFEVHPLGQGPDGTPTCPLIPASGGPVLATVEDGPRSWDARVPLRLLAPGTPNDGRTTWIRIEDLASGPAVERDPSTLRARIAP